jgi:hypothetical protein
MKLGEFERRQAAGTLPAETVRGFGEELRRILNVAAPQKITGIQHAIRKMQDFVINATPEQRDAYLKANDEYNLESIAIFEQMRVEYGAVKKATKKADEAEPIEKARRRSGVKKLAIENKAIIELPELLSIPTGKPHMNAFTLKREGDAYVISLEDGVINTMKADEKTGKLSLKNERWMEPIRFENKETKEVVTGAALAYIAGLYTIELKYGEGTTGTTVYKLHRPTFCEFMGANPYHEDHKGADFVEKVKEALKDVVGYMKNGQAYYGVFFVLGRDNTDDTIEITIPYLSHLRREIEKFPGYKKQIAGKVETLPHHSGLIHSTIAAEKDQIAVSIVRYFDRLIQSRPNTKHNTTDKNGKQQVEVEKGTVSKPQNVSWRTILEDIPEFLHGFNAPETRIIKPPPAGKTNTKPTRTTDLKNQYLRRRIGNAYRIIYENTELMSFFINLRWYSYDKKGAIDNFPIPTITTLDSVLYFTHEGQNKEWKQVFDKKQEKAREQKKVKAAATKKKRKNTKAEQKKELES